MFCSIKIYNVLLVSYFIPVTHRGTFEVKQYLVQIYYCKISSFNEQLLRRCTKVHTLLI